MVRDLPRRLQDTSYDHRVRQCVRPHCSRQQSYTWNAAVAACAEVGAAVCTREEFDGAPLFGVLSPCDSDSASSQQMREAQAFVNSEEDGTCATDERLVVRNACMDWDNDCCVGHADDDHHDHDDDGANDLGGVEQAACAAGYEVRQLQSGGSCDDPERRSPTFECVPTGTAASNCVSASAQVNSVVCCAVDACTEGGKRDTDCCTTRGNGGCLDGCTSVCAHHLSYPCPTPCGSDWLLAVATARADTPAAPVPSMASVAFRYIRAERPWK